VRKLVEVSLVRPDVLHVGRHGKKPVDTGHAVKCKLDDRIPFDSKLERGRELNARFRQHRVVLHVTRYGVHHVGVALDERPVDVTKMMEELRARHRRVAAAGNHHLQQVQPLSRATRQAAASYNKAVRLTIICRNQSKHGSSSSW
jgi:hypothetical protein